MDSGQDEQGPQGEVWSCSTCGALTDDEAEKIRWSMGVERGRVAHTCPTCARANVRAIEGKLESQWW